MDARGAHVRPAFDDALNAYEFVLDAATMSVEITEKWIKEIHAIICSSQRTYRVLTPTGPRDQPLPKGTYKTMPNSPTLLDGRVHAYAPVNDTGPEMRRLVDELRCPEFKSAHTILQAAYAHYAYVCIHPFADGNGRVARALSSVFLYRQPGIPLIVFADQRNSYYDALEAADNGDPSLFVEFIATRAIDAMNLIRTMLQNSARPAEKTIQSLNKLFDSGVRDEELAAAGGRLRDMARAETGRQLKQLAVPSALSISTTTIRIPATPKAQPGYADIGRNGSWSITARADFPVRITVLIAVGTFVKITPDAHADLMIQSNVDRGLEVWLRELVPEATEQLKLKLAAWAEAVIATLLEKIEEEARKRR